MSKTGKTAVKTKTDKIAGDTPELRKRVKAVAMAYSAYGSGRMEEASSTLGVSREALSNFLAGGPVRRGTIALLNAFIDSAEKKAGLR